jgi:hypothetical protein
MPNRTKSDGEFFFEPCVIEITKQTLENFQVLREYDDYCRDEAGEVLRDENDRTIVFTPQEVQKMREMNLQDIVFSEPYGSQEKFFDINCKDKSIRFSNRPSSRGELRAGLLRRLIESKKEAGSNISLYDLLDVEAKKNDFIVSGFIASYNEHYTTEDGVDQNKRKLIFNAFSELSYACVEYYKKSIDGLTGTELTNKKEEVKNFLIDFVDANKDRIINDSLKGKKFMKDEFLFQLNIEKCFKDLVRISKEGEKRVKIDLAEVDTVVDSGSFSDENNKQKTKSYLAAFRKNIGDFIKELGDSLTTDALKKFIDEYITANSAELAEKIKAGESIAEDYFLLALRKYAIEDGFNEFCKGLPLYPDHRPFLATFLTENINRLIFKNISDAKSELNKFLQHFEIEQFFVISQNGQSNNNSVQSLVVAPVVLDDDIRRTIAGFAGAATEDSGYGIISDKNSDEYYRAIVLDEFADAYRNAARKVLGDFFGNIPEKPEDWTDPRYSKLVDFVNSNASDLTDLVVNRKINGKTPEEIRENAKKYFTKAFEARMNDKYEDVYYLDTKLFLLRSNIINKFNVDMLASSPEDVGSKLDQIIAEFPEDDKFEFAKKNLEVLVGNCKEYYKEMEEKGVPQVVLVGRMRKYMEEKLHIAFVKNDAARSKDWHDSDLIDPKITLKSNEADKKEIKNFINRLRNLGDSHRELAEKISALYDCAIHMPVDKEKLSTAYKEYNTALEDVNKNVQAKIDATSPILLWLKVLFGAEDTKKLSSKNMPKWLAKKIKKLLPEDSKQQPAPSVPSP